MSTASSKSVDKQQNAEVSKVGEEATSSASPSTSNGQQQTVGDSSVAEEAILSPPAALIDHENAGPSTEDQLRKQIARLEDDIHQLKLDQGPNREAVKHTLLRDDLAQLREENLNLRVELQVAQESVRVLEKKLEKHQVMGSEFETCKQWMQKAIDDLSTGLELSNNKSPNLGLATKAVPFDASLLPQQPVSSGLVETATSVSNPFESKRDKSSSTPPTSSTDTNTSIKFGTFNQPPSRPSQEPTSPPKASQTDQLPTITPFPGTASASTFPAFHPLATKASSTVTSIDCNDNLEPAATPKLQETSGNSALGSTGALDLYKFLGGSSSSPSQNMFQAKNEPKIGDVRGARASGRGKKLALGTLQGPRAVKPE